MPELVEMPAPTQKTTFSGALARMYLESEVCRRTGQNKHRTEEGRSQHGEREQEIGWGSTYSAIPSRSFDGRMGDISALVDRVEFTPINDDFLLVHFFGM